MGEIPLNRNGGTYKECDIVYSIWKRIAVHKRTHLIVANQMEYKDSKSFLSILVLMLRCILYPGSKLFITTGGKEQAAGIAREKVEELCKLIPGLKNEIDWRPGKTIASKDMVSYRFKDDSNLDIIAARQSSRGKRKHGGLIEECILVDGTLLNEVIIPSYWGLAA